MKEVADIVGIHYRTMQEWIAWYRQGSIAEVRQHRHGGHGGKQPRLTPEQEAALKAKSAAGEIRTAWEAVEWVEKGLGVKYTYWGMRWVFARLGLKKKVPRPVSAAASAEQQKAWKKGGLLTS